MFICRRERGKHALKEMLSGNRIVGPTTILQVNIICIVDVDVDVDVDVVVVDVVVVDVVVVVVVVAAVVAIQKTILK